MTRTVVTVLLLLVSAPALSNQVVPSIFCAFQQTLLRRIEGLGSSGTYAFQPQPLVSNSLDFDTPKHRALIVAPEANPTILSASCQETPRVRVSHPLTRPPAASSSWKRTLMKPVRPASWDLSTRGIQ